MVCSLVNSILSVTWTDADVSAPCANAEAVTSAPCAKADADTTAFSPNPFASKSDSSLEEVKETLISDCDMINEPVVSSILILLDIEADILIYGNIPIGCGMSSSTALVISVVKTICHLFNIQLIEKELAKLCQIIENNALGNSSGLLDQYGIIFSKKKEFM